MTSVFILTNDLNSGAVPHLLVDIIDNMSNDIEVTIGVIIGGPDYVNKDIVERLQLNDVRINNYQFSGGSVVISAISLFRDLRDVDIVHTHLPRSDFFGRILGYISGIDKIITTEHTPYSRLNKKQSIAAYLTIPLVDELVAVSQEVERSIPKKYSRLSHTDTHIVPNTVDNSDIPEKEIDSENLPVSENKITLASVGRLIPEKNHELLINALAELKSHKTKYELVLVGDGSERESMCSLAQEVGVAENVVITGWLERDSVFQILFNSQIFLIPSKKEGMPLAALEAMATGTPIVASDIPALRETIGDAGLYASYREMSEWVTAIKEYASNDELSRQKGEVGQCRVERLFSPRSIAKKYEEMYKSEL